MQRPSTQTEFDAILAKAAADGSTVVVDFAAEWCGPCKRIGPVFDALSKEFPHVVFVRVDVDENKEVAKACEISAMPTFKFFQNKAEVASLQGADPDALRELVVKHQGDKWGEGQSLGGGGGAADAGMSEKEKRMAALAARGL